VSYQVRPDDVVVLDQSGNAIPPDERGFAATLRRIRLRAAIGIGIVLGLLALFGGLSKWILVLVAIGLVVFHFNVGRQLRYATLRQVSWIGTFGVTLGALLPAIIGFVAFSVILIGMIALLIALMLLMGDRKK
jgi:hypothetical protein